MNNKNSEFSVPSIKETSNEYVDKFMIIKNIEENEKLIIKEDKLYLDDNYPLIQTFTRWWNNHNRIDICKKLDEMFKNYFIFLEMINEAIKNNNDLVEVYQVRLIEAKHDKFNKNLISGLNNMKSTYFDCQSSYFILDNIINQLNKYTSSDVYCNID